MGEFAEKILEYLRFNDNTEEIDLEDIQEVEDIQEKKRVDYNEAKQIQESVEVMVQETSKTPDQGKRWTKNPPPNKIYSEQIEIEKRTRIPFQFKKSVDEIIPSYRIKLLLRDIESSFARVLTEHLKKSGKDNQEICNQIGMERSELLRMRNDSDYIPDKNSILALVIALKLSEKEALHLLEAAGYTLSKSQKKDLIILYFIKEGQYNLGLINQTLRKFDCTTLDV